MLILHYLDDFLMVGQGRDEVRKVLRKLVKLFQKKRFVVSPKSTLVLAQQIAWLGELCDFR